MIKTRFAPSPTGSLHIGGVRTALYNFLFARHNGGVFALRIEDTDRARTVPGAQEEIEEVLTWLGLNYDEGPVLQSTRLPLYKNSARVLFERGAAYWCHCSPERLAQLRTQQQAAGQSPRYDGACRERGLEDADGAVLRLKVPHGRTITFTDALRGEISFSSDAVDDQILMKSDGYPTYHLANVVDDQDMGVSHVIRGEEWLSSTPKHVLLYEALAWHLPVFAHLPLILAEGGGKLSKRSGHAAAIEYMRHGYLPEAMINFLALLGWNPRADCEVYTIDELIEFFDIARVNRGGAAFSHAKLEWISREHMKRADTARLAALAAPFLADKGLNTSGVNLETVMEVEKERIGALSEAGEETAFVFQQDLAYAPNLLVGKNADAREAHKRLERMRSVLTAQETGAYTAIALKDKIMALITRENLGNAETLWPLRTALTGRAQSPGPFEAAAALGKGRTLARIDAALRFLTN